MRVLGKGARERTVGIPEPARRAIESWLAARVDTTDTLFTDIGGDPITPQAVQNLFTRARDRLGLKRLSPHDLRRWWANKLIEQGYNIHEVKAQGGWNTWQAMERYIYYGMQRASARRLSKHDFGLSGQFGQTTMSM